VEDSLLYSLNYLHAGALKFWVVVPPSERDRLVRRLLEHYEGARPPCSQFVRHMSVWVPVEVLERWDIAHVGVEQRPSDLFVTASGTHQDWNAGWNIAEAVNYGDGASATRVRGYRHCKQTCPIERIVIWPETIPEGASDPERQTSLRVWKAGQDSVLRAKVARAVGVENLLLPDRPALTEEQLRTMAHISQRLRKMMLSMETDVRHLADQIARARRKMLSIL
jgi:hypothetical protein